MESVENVILSFSVCSVGSRHSGPDTVLYSAAGLVLLWYWDNFVVREAAKDLGVLSANNKKDGERTHQHFWKRIDLKAWGWHFKGCTGPLGEIITTSKR